MLNIQYTIEFDRNLYYDEISTKRFDVYLCKKNKNKKCIKDKNDKTIPIIRNEFKSIKTFEKLKSITLLEVFNEYKKSKKDDFHIIFKDISFKCLIIGNFHTLKKIKENIETSDRIKNNKSIKFLFDYTALQPKKIKPFFEDNLNIYTCYYCNIDYVNSYTTRKNNKTKKKNKFTLDHYYDKATYPYLALSLYNFVPSCYTCNTKLKGIKEFNNLSPSSSKFNFHQKVKFKLFLSDSCKNLHIKDKEDITIPLRENYSDEYSKYLEVFKLNERYEVHKDIVFEMIQKAELYPDSRLKELENLTGIPYQQIKKDIFNLIDENENLSKKPFSKLIVDISNELGLI